MGCVLSDLLQSFDERSIRREHVFIRQPGRNDPLQPLTVQAARFAIVTLDDPHRKLDVIILICMTQRHQRAPAHQLNAELFFEFPRQRRGIAFARRDFAPGKLPASRHVLAGWPLGDEHFAASIEQRRCDDSNAGLTQRSTARRGSACIFCPSRMGKARFARLSARCA